MIELRRFSKIGTDSRLRGFRFGFAIKFGVPDPGKPVKQGSGSYFATSGEGL